MNRLELSIAFLGVFAAGYQAGRWQSRRQVQAEVRVAADMPAGGGAAPERLATRAAGVGSLDNPAVRERHAVGVGEATFDNPAVRQRHSVGAGYAEWDNPAVRERHSVGAGYPSLDNPAVRERHAVGANQGSKLAPGRRASGAGADSKDGTAAKAGQDEKDAKKASADDAEKQPAPDLNAE